MSQPNSIDPALGPVEAGDAGAAGLETPVVADVPKPTRRRGFDVYTMMLILSAVSLLIGTILLYLDRLAHQ